MVTDMNGIIFLIGANLSRLYSHSPFTSYIYSLELFFFAYVLQHDSAHCIKHKGTLHICYHH